MHGVVKEKKTEAQLKETADKISLYVRVTAAILKNKDEGVFSESTLVEGAKMCSTNPDFYSVWNYRRLNLQALWTAAPDTKARLCAGELEVTQNGLARNPKSYCAWHHRVWVVLQGTTDLNRELAICTKYLKLDSRNFHVWNYRRFIVRQCEKRNAEVLAAAAKAATAAAATAPAPVGGATTAAAASSSAAVKVPFPNILQSELAFTREKINENFSNYSAWHYRSVLIPRIVKHDGASDAAIEQILNDEFELVRNAFFTEPSDQSSWLYHRWLLGKVVAGRLAVTALGGVSLGIAAPTATATAAADGKSAPAAAEAASLSAAAATAAATTKAAESAVASSSSVAAAALTTTGAFADDHLISLPHAKQIAVLQREYDSLHELADVEPNCKWVWLTIAILMGALEDAKAAAAAATAAAANKPAPPPPPAAETAEKLSRASALFTRLIALDPMRTHYYESVQKRLNAQISRN